MTTPTAPKTSTATRFGWSYLSQWATCQTRWWNSQLRRHPKAPDGQLGLERRYQSDALLIGSAFHRFAEDWYLSGWSGDKDTGQRDLDKPLSSAVELIQHQSYRLKSQDDGTKAEAVVRGLALGYHQRYLEDTLRVAPAPDGTPLVEQEFTLDVGDGHLFTSRIDTVVFEQDDPEGLWDLEHKTADVSKVSQLKEAFYVDGQITGQQLQMEAHWGPRVRGIRANIAVKRAKNIPPYQRQDYHRGQAQLEKFQMDVRRRLKGIREGVAKYDMLLEAGMSQDEAARVAFDASQAGTQTCVSCDFLALCKNRSQSELIADIDFIPREPR